jgi:hypothetical protein
MRFLPPAALALLTFTGCLGSGDGGDGGSVGLNIHGSVEVLSIDRQAHTIKSRSSITECQEDGTALSSMDTTLQHYAIKDGKMVMWEEEECTASIYTGSSSDIVGTWTSKGLESELPIPAEYRPASCPANPSVDSSNAKVLSDLNATFVITETKVDISASGPVCMGENLAEELKASGLDIESKDCERVTARDPAGNPVVMTAVPSGNQITIQAIYKGKTCTLTSDMPIPGQTVDCAKRKAAQEAYKQCVTDAAAAPKISGALRKAAAKLF